MAAVAAAKAAVLAHSSVKAPLASLAEKVIQKVAEEPSVFALESHIDVDLISWLVCGLIVFTILFEMGIHQLTHYLSSDEVYSEALEKVFKELTIMGFISFIMLLLSEFLEIPEHVELLFEFAHIWIFFVALVFIVHAVIFMASLSASQKKYKAFEAVEHTPESLANCRLEGTETGGSCARRIAIGSSEQEAALSYEVGKEIFRDHHKLESTFNFQLYMSESAGKTVVRLLDTSETTWLCLLVLFLLNVARNHLVDYINGAPQSNPAALATIDKLTFPKGVSFMHLSVHHQETLLATHKRNLWTFMIFGWFILLTNFATLLWCRYITASLLYAGRPAKFRNGGELDEESQDLLHHENSMASRLPCGSTKVFYYCLELVIMVQCFYLGLMCLLNGRAAYTHFAPPFGFLFLLAMFVPIAINLFATFPAQIKAIAFLSALTELDGELLHEVEMTVHTQLLDFEKKVKKNIFQTLKKTPEEATEEIFNKCKIEGSDHIDHKKLKIVLKNEPYNIKFNERADQFFNVFKQIDTEDAGFINKGQLGQLLSASANVSDEASSHGHGHGHH